MEYSGKSSNECSVTIHNVTDAHNCTWAARLEDDLVLIFDWKSSKICSIFPLYVKNEKL